VQRSGEVLAAERARWLAEISVALSEARQLVKELGAAEGRFEALELYAQIEALRLEVEAMRVRRREPFAPETGSEWSNPPWRLPFPTSISPGSEADQMPSGMSPPPENGSRNGSSTGGFQPDVATNALFRKASLP
jgi:hypothetical protein